MLQVRIDDETKNKASELFNALGLDLSTAVRIFLLKSIAVGGIPFEMNINSSGAKAIAAMERMGQKSKELGNDKLSLDEINDIIAQTRNETEVEKLASIIGSTGGNGEISEQNQKIIHLYCIGDIDYETAVFAIKRNLKKEI